MCENPDANSGEEWLSAPVREKLVSVLAAPKPRACDAPVLVPNDEEPNPNSLECVEPFPELNIEELDSVPRDRLGLEPKDEPDSEEEREPNEDEPKLDSGEREAREPNDDEPELDSDGPPKLELLEREELEPEPNKDGPKLDSLERDEPELESKGDDPKLLECEKLEPEPKDDEPELEPPPKLAHPWLLAWQ